MQGKETTATVRKEKNDKFLIVVVCIYITASKSLAISGRSTYLVGRPNVIEYTEYTTHTITLKVTTTRRVTIHLGVDWLSLPDVAEELSSVELELEL